MRFFFAPTLTRLLALAAAAALLTPVASPARPSSWQDTAGTRFRGEPTEILGPFALFKTGQTTGRRVLLRGLAPDDILRLHKEISTRPPLAARWPDAQAAATSELPGNVLRVEKDTLVPASLDALPEPELLLVLFGSHNDSESWALMRTLTAVYERTQRVYPGKLACVFIGVRHNQREHLRFATVTAMPWLVADFPSQPELRVLTRFAPAEGPRLLLLSRHGVPLFVAPGDDLEEIKKFADNLAEILAASDPANPRAWADRLHYLGLTRPLDFANTSAPPLLVGDPLRPDGLRLHGVERIDARLEIAADGSVAAVIFKDTSVFPPELKSPLQDALLHQARFLPAIKNGAAIPGTAGYSLLVPPENKVLAADTSWLNGDARHEIPLPSWLVLHPIPVEEQNFTGTIDHIDEMDTVVLAPLRVSGAKVSRQAQMNAFNDDWFSEAGAASVQPAEGAPQLIDGTPLLWKRLPAPGGYVDLGEHEYSVGYAWTEFDSPAETDAWLGFGSDDGVKLWLNGELVSDRWIRRLSRLDDDIVPVRLKKGKNQLLLKIQNASGGWSFLARLRTR